jgi:hypothetical protein
VCRRKKDLFLRILFLRILFLRILFLRILFRLRPEAPHSIYTTLGSDNDDRVLRSITY